ncbi:hypothetical protein C4572_03765 [Candidatus Parcubacteria bacterium]|nr:MAG: hypothetical protein C4572_03765 [Candidatus Parcubacteria bacterium]
MFFFFYIFIFGIIALGSFVYWLFVRNALAKRMAEIFGAIFLSGIVLSIIYISLHIEGEDEAHLGFVSRIVLIAARELIQWIIRI